MLLTRSIINLIDYLSEFLDKQKEFGTYPKIDGDINQFLKIKFFYIIFSNGN